MVARRRLGLGGLRLTRESASVIALFAELIALLT